MGFSGAWNSLSCLISAQAALLVQQVHTPVPLSPSEKLFLLPMEPDAPQASPGWECSCSPRSEVFSQLHSELNNAQGRHFDHLCLQIPGDIFLPGLGSPGSLSGKPRHGKTIPSLVLFPCFGKKTPLQSVQQLAESPPCTPGAFAELSLSPRTVTFRIFPKKETSSQAFWHGASK